MGLTIAAMPAYNEERSIARMVAGAKKYVDQVVVVDDGSFDRTAKIAEALGAYVVRHENPIWPGLTTTIKTQRLLSRRLSHSAGSAFNLQLRGALA